MAGALESNFLVPNGTLLIEVALYALVFALLMLWPLVGAAIRRQWGWVVMILIFGPFAGSLWFFMGRSGRDHSAETATSST